MSAISNTREVDYLKVAGLKRIKMFLLLKHLRETKRAGLSPCELRR